MRQLCGCDNVMHSPEYRRRQIDAVKEIYGVENVFSHPDIIDKIHETMTEKYGAPHPSQCPELLDRKKENFRSNWGYDCSFQDPGTRDKINKTMDNRYGGTGWGSPDIMGRIQTTNLRRYGYRHPMENPDVYERAIKNGFGKTKNIFKDGESKEEQFVANHIRMMINDTKFHLVTSKVETFITGGRTRRWDMVMMRRGRPWMFIEYDGSFWHNLFEYRRFIPGHFPRGSDGYKSQEKRDSERERLIPEGSGLFIVYDNWRTKECLDELNKLIHDENFKPSGWVNRWQYEIFDASARFHPRHMRFDAPIRTIHDIQ